MAITLFGSVAVPTDNGTNTANPTAFANPPIASMVAGDLVFVYAYCRTSSATIAVSNAGGQTWFSGTSQSSANATLSANYFWCRYNGTWSAAPSFSFGATTNNNVVMLVFRPTSGNNFWNVDPSQTGSFVDRAAAASFTITGWTPVHDSNVSIGVWNTDDDNTWGTLTGTNWVKTSLSAQYRNTSGSDASSSFAYQIQTAKAATNNVAQTEATLGNDGGFTFAICFREFSPTDFIARNIEQPYFGKQMVSTSGQKILGKNPTYVTPRIFYRTLTLDQPASDLTDFPILFSGTLSYLANVVNGGRVANSNGYDIVFYSDSSLTTKLDFERVYYNSTTGECEFWIKIPTLTSANATVIYLSYGNPNILTDQQNAVGTWSNGFISVYHLANGTSLSAADSLGANNGVINGSPVAAATKIDGGMRLSGNTNDYIETNIILPTTDFTISVWGKSSSSGPPNRVMGNGDSQFGLSGADIIWSFLSSDQLYCAFRNAGTNLDVDTTLIGLQTGWHYIVTQMDSSFGAMVYGDGGFLASNTGGTSITSSLTFRIGKDGNKDDAFNGDIDEVRISSVVRTATWIATEYSNQNDPANFYVIGGETIP